MLFYGTFLLLITGLGYAASQQHRSHSGSGSESDDLLIVQTLSKRGFNASLSPLTDRWEDSGPESKSAKCTIMLASCPFAVKSGGHAPFAGASSIDRGITVSLERLDGLILSDYRRAVAVGPGNTWGSVYRFLSPYNLTVSGGRVSDVGVGGLSLGGGISFFANKHGWACDNVVSYEVVTASGDVLQASPFQNQELYFALRGGGNNFGIVTAFKFLTLPLPGGMLWAADRAYGEKEFPALTHAFTQMSSHPEQDLDAGSWLTWSMNNGSKSAHAELFHAKQDSSKATIFSNYNAIPAISDKASNQQLTDLTDDQGRGVPSGYRQYFYTMTFKNNEVLNNIAKDIYFSELDPFTKPGSNGLLRMFFQSITVPQIQNMARRGGNPLGTEVTDGPLTLILLAATWQDIQHDEVFYAVGSNILKRIKVEAAKRNLTNDYLYMNYAAPYQDVVSSYGVENREKLARIAEKFDPKHVFQGLQPGYVKLGRAAFPGTDYFNF